MGGGGGHRCRGEDRGDSEVRGVLRLVSASRRGVSLRGPFVALGNSESGVPIAARGVVCLALASLVSQSPRHDGRGGGRLDSRPFHKRTSSPPAWQLCCTDRLNFGMSLP